MDTEHNDAPEAEAPVTEPRSTSLIVFGLDEAQKPHASWFDETDAPLAEKAAGLMGMKILRLTSDEQRGLAGKLPKGRVFGSGKCFVPFTNKNLYSQLEAIGGEEPPVDPAVVQAALDDEPAGEAALSPVASSWAAITVGSVVLVTEGHMEGWFEAVVTAAKPNNLFELRWRDWPDEPVLVRKRGQLGLLPPAEAAQKA
jgi:hypothetical protein